MQTKYYIKEEGWTPPKTFSEYYKRFPDYHKKWLTKRYSSFSNSDFDDVAQFLLLETLRKERVEKFKPSKGLTNRPGLFFGWMSRCFNRDLATLLGERKRRMRIVNYHTISLDKVTKEGREVPGRRQADSFLVEGSPQYRRKTEQAGVRPYLVTRVNEFRDYIKKHRPHMIPALDRVEDGNATIKEKNQFRYLASLFEKGKVPRKGAIKY
jgi:hypothetical protein